MSRCMRAFTLDVGTSKALDAMVAAGFSNPKVRELFPESFLTALTTVATEQLDDKNLRQSDYLALYKMAEIDYKPPAIFRFGSAPVFTVPPKSEWETLMSKLVMLANKSSNHLALVNKVLAEAKAIGKANKKTVQQTLTRRSTGPNASRLVDALLVLAMKTLTAPEERLAEIEPIGRTQRDAQKGRIERAGRKAS